MALLPYCGTLKDTYSQPPTPQSPHVLLLLGGSRPPQSNTLRESERHERYHTAPMIVTTRRSRSTYSGHSMRAMHEYCFFGCLARDTDVFPFGVLPKKWHDSTTVEYLVSLVPVLFSAAFAFACPADTLPASIASEDTSAASNSRERATAATGDGGGIGSCSSYEDITKPLRPGRNKNA